MKWLKRIVGIALTAYLGICIYMYCEQEKLLFHPHRLAADFQYPFKGKFKEFNLTIDQNCQVNVLQFFADTPTKGVVVYFHGNGEELDYSGTKAPTFTQRGYDCLMVDYPTYGKSTGKLSEENLFKTGKALMAVAKQQYPSDRIVVYGRSLGTGIAAHTARDAAWFKALILEAPYYSITDVAQRQYPFLPVALLNRYPLSTYQYLKDLQHPTYVIHGTADDLIPIESPQKFLKLGLKQLHFITIQDAKHGNLADFKEYNQVVDEVLN